MINLAGKFRRYLSALRSASQDKTMVVFALTLVRHGETGHNKNHIIQGHLDIPLSEIGVQQAEELAINLQNQKYTHIYSSDLLRAKQTAEVILKKNKFSMGPIIEDSRLRERKFGIVEGKNFKFLKDAAAAADKTVGVFTPPGAESAEQVRQRAISFFQELCKLFLIISTESQRGSDHCSASLDDTEASNDEKCSSGEDYSCLSDSEATVRNEGCVKRKREDSRSDQENGVAEDTVPSTDKNSGYSSKVFSDDCNIPPTMATTVKSKDAPRPPTPMHSPATDARHRDQLLNSNSETDSNGAMNKSSSIVIDDNLIRARILPPTVKGEDGNCPNVSLSPLREQYLSLENMNNPGLSHAHARNRQYSSCQSSDEVESAPPFAANVLIVAHGGLLREIIRHFVEDLECPVPGGKKQALRISPNAGVSKFTISLNTGDERPKVICLQIHDKQHLQESHAQNDSSIETTAL